MSNEDGYVSIRGKRYATVARRVALFREKYPIESGYGIRSEIIHHDENRFIVRAWITVQGPGDSEVIVSEGFAEELRTKSGVNSTSPLENAHTSAVGRALAFANFQGSELNIASADEMLAALSQQQQNAPAPQRAQAVADAVPGVSRGVSDPAPVKHAQSVPRPTQQYDDFRRWLAVQANEYELSIDELKGMANVEAKGLGHKAGYQDMQAETFFGPIKAKLKHQIELAKADKAEAGAANGERTRI